MDVKERKLYQIREGKKIDRGRRDEGSATILGKEGRFENEQENAIETYAESSSDGLHKEQMCQLKFNPENIRQVSVGYNHSSILTGIYGIYRREVSAEAPEEVLTVRTARVHKLAVADVLVGVVLGVRCHSGVPAHGLDVDSGAGGVMIVHEVLRGVLGEGRVRPWPLPDQSEE
ncbi:hypothetical protein Cni_G16588 [Canna indica]|uniref:Uncharacterized protein n=1 Tax=Canna indica TaxID=4628 RepID=A0AAQ3KFD4_9LILI|nr:hypothetical protein Cni_G16588 [Canna indica]